MGSERILIIENEPEIQGILQYTSTREGWKLVQAETSEEGFKTLQATGADCVILDIMLPGMDGLETLKKIRKEKRFQTLPVILCTDWGEETDVVAGLELGADDCVIKPYSPHVLAARIRASLRRKEAALLEAKDSSQAETHPKTFWQHGKLSLDVKRHTVFLDKTLLDIFNMEFAILAQFMGNPDIVFSRRKLITAIRGGDYPVTDRSVDPHIMGLRRKLGEAGRMIETIRGVGYRFKTSG